MSKTVDWDSNYKSPLRGKRSGPGASYNSRKEQVQEAYRKMADAEKAQAEFSRLEPHLRKALLEHMVGRKPIRVEQTMHYLTEGLAKSNQADDELDRSFYNRSKSEDADPGKFEIQKREIAPGTELVFKSINASLGQWIFKSSTGEEIEIYDKPVVAISADRQVPNPGFWGLLTHTNIYSDTLARLSAPGEDE